MGMEFLYVGSCGLFLVVFRRMKALILIISLFSFSYSSLGLADPYIYANPKKLPSSTKEQYCDSVAGSIQYAEDQYEGRVCWTDQSCNSVGNNSTLAILCDNDGVPDCPYGVDSDNSCYEPPEECVDVPNFNECDCQYNGGFWDGIGNICEAIPECTGEDTYDGVFNGCFDDQGCEAGYSLNAVGTCEIDPEPEPEPEPDPDPEPDPNADPDPDPSTDMSADDDGDGTNNGSDDDIDGDGVTNDLDPDFKQSIDLSGVESRLNTANKHLNSIDQRVKQSNAHLNNLSANSDKDLETQKSFELGIGAVNKKLGDIAGELGGSGPATGDQTGLTPTIEQSNAALKAAVLDHPFILSLFTIPTLNGSGSCPTYSMDLGRYGNHTMSNHCTLLNDNRSLLSALFIMLWTLGAAMLFLRA